MRAIFQIFQVISTIMVLAIFYLVVGAVLCSYLDGFFPIFEPLANLRFQLAAICMVMLVVSLGLWRWKMAATLLGLSFVLCVMLVDDLINVERKAPEWNKPTLRVVVFNVDQENWRYAETLQWLRETNADMVLLQEIDEHWFVQIELLSDIYPHRLARPREDGYGGVLLSKLPFESADLLYLSEAKKPVFRVQTEWEGRPLTFLGVRPTRGSSTEDQANRAREFEGLVQQVKEAPGRVIVAGDLGTTAGSTRFATLLREAELGNASLGFGFQPTWPVPVPLLGMTVDHVLISGRALVYNFERGPHLGSDHFPVVADLTVRKSRAKAAAAARRTLP